MAMDLLWIKYLEAKQRDPPPLEGELQVVCWVVMINRGHQGDLEEKKPCEGSQELPTSLQETESKCVDAKNF